MRREPSRAAARRLEPGADQHEGRRGQVEGRLDLDLGLWELAADPGREFVRLLLGEGADRQEPPASLEGHRLVEQVPFQGRGLGAIARART